MSLYQEGTRKRFLSRVAGVRRDKVYIGPETVHFHLTNKCNLRCLFCWAHAPGSAMHLQPPRHFPFRKFAEIVRDCYDLKVDAIHLSAEGEPALHPRFADMMDLLGKMPFFVQLLTNGTFSPEQRRAVLKADQVVINLGAVDREGYKALHGKDYFERVIGNIRSLVRYNDKEKKSLSVKILFIKNTMNVEALPAMRVLAQKLGVGLVEKEMLPTLHNERIRLPGKISRERQGKAMLPCYYGWFYASITHEADVSLCCYIYNTGGMNLKNISFKEAWSSASWMRLRSQAAKGSLAKDFPECWDCPASMRNIESRPPLKGIVPGAPGRR